MRLFGLFAGMGLIFGAAFWAHAQGTPADDKYLLEQLLAADRNKDGKLTFLEVDGVSGTPLFGALDANKDRVVTLDEVRANLHIFLEQRKASPPAWPPKPSQGLVPLTDLKTGTYKGKEGGLYPGGKNERPAAHEEAGLRLARSIKPLDGQGQPYADGKVVFLSIGMSNTTQEFSTFKPIADADPGKNPRLVIVDGAQGGRTAALISNTESPGGKNFWETIDQRLKAAGLTPAQVQIAWIKQADGNPKVSFEDYATKLENEHELIVQILQQRYPNIKLCYLSSRIYGGYATTRLNPEPYAYAGGFAVKWLIEKQLAGDPALSYDAAKGPVKAPWLAWGPYLWADGQKPRADGLTYDPTDLRPDDHTHPGFPARQKVAKQLLDFLKTDSTARIWFLGTGG